MSRPAFSETAGTPALWFAVFGPPAAWFGGLVASYFAVHEVCRVASPLSPRLISVVALLAALTAGVVARFILLRSYAHERTRFMAQIGLLSSGVFSLILVLQIVATFLLPGCQERPRTHQSPDVLRTPAARQPVT